jgi:uncharacterized protein
MFNDPGWARFDFKSDYPFGVLVLKVTTMTRGFNPTEFWSKDDSPYEFAKEHGLKTGTLDDYLAVLDKLFAHAEAKGGVCLKTTLAYERGLDFANVPRDQVTKAFDQPQTNLTAAEVKDFEDFVMWRLVELSARHELPFQIHTGDARIQGSNPMNLVDLIDANAKTKFILFHGGYPWIVETGAIASKHSARVRYSCWLPTISYTLAKRSFHEWLDVMPSDRIMRKANCNHTALICGATRLPAGAR